MNHMGRYAMARVMAAVMAGLLGATAAAQSLPDPDGKPANMSKPVQVFIIMGQSNTLEMGKVGGDTDGALEHAVKTKGLYPYLIDDEGNWTTRQDVRNVSVMTGRKGIYRNEWLTVNKKGKIGIEIGIGNQLGQALDAPVMILKSSIGNRSLGWDLLPPGSERFEFTDPRDGKTYVYPGYKDEVRYSRWEKGLVPDPPKHTWYAGKQYDDDVANAKKILADLDKYYPGAQGYEVAGFLWWQGDKDRYDAGHAARYETNLVTMIKALRKEFNAPNAKFVAATLGQTPKDGGNNPNEKKILDAMMAVDGNSGKYREFRGNVATVYTHPLRGGGTGSSNAHYGGNAETYMNVGEAMGKAMAELIK